MQNFDEEQLFDELEYINRNFDFSEKCTHDLMTYILDQGLAYHYDGTLMLTSQGELEIGYTNEELGYDHTHESNIPTQDELEEFYNDDSIDDLY